MIVRLMDSSICVRIPLKFEGYTMSMGFLGGSVENNPPANASWGAREVGSPCEWRGGARHSHRGRLILAPACKPFFHSFTTIQILTV